MRFAIASEGKTDFVVLKNLLIGFFQDKNLPVTPLRPKDREPFGWGNLLKYIATQEFRDTFDDDNIDYVVVQIDSKECADWPSPLTQIGDDAEQVAKFIDDVGQCLAQHMGQAFYEANRQKMLFAICVHEIECWLLPFNTDVKAHVKKLVGCFGTIEKLCNAKGFSIAQKNYQEGKFYDDLSKDMRSNKELLRKGILNPSLSQFLCTMQVLFPGGGER